MKEQLRLSIEQCIRDHLAQDLDTDSAIVAASKEIVDAISRPLDNGPSRNDALALIERIDQTLRVPAAEYVPAIGDVFTLIDQFKKETAI